MNNMLDFFEKIKELNVLVIGDLMIDAYTWGKVSRISPEAPVPVVNATKREIRLGGAGNVVMNLASLGAKPFMISVLGDDDAGRDLIQIFEKEGLPTEGLCVESNRSTTVKERIIAGSQQLLRIDTETEKAIQLADGCSK